MAGRKPKHEFNLLELGERAVLRGKANKYPSQYINQYNNNKEGRRIKLVREDGKAYAERIK